MHLGPKSALYQDLQDPIAPNKPPRTPQFCETAKINLGCRSSGCADVDAECASLSLLFGLGFRLYGFIGRNNMCDWGVLSENTIVDQMFMSCVWKEASGAFKGLIWDV